MTSKKQKREYAACSQKIFEVLGYAALVSFVCLFYCLFEARSALSEFEEKSSGVASLVKVFERMKLDAIYEGYLYWSETADAVENGDEEFLDDLVADMKKIAPVSAVRFFTSDGNFVFSKGDPGPAGNTFFNGTKLYGTYRLPVARDDGSETGNFAVLEIEVADIQKAVGSFFKSLPAPWPYLLDLSDSGKTPDGTFLFGDVHIETPGIFAFLISLGTPLLFRIALLCFSSGAFIAAFFHFSRRSGSLGKLSALASVLEARDEYTAEHSTGTSEFACAIAREMGYSSANISLLERAALNHDIGKIFVPDSILLKPGALTEDEFETMKKHPEDGARIIAPPLGKEAAEIVLHHHERWDGKGYPNGTKGKNIPELARIMSVADVYNALVTDRPYRKRMERKAAEKIIVDGAGTLFDPRVVEAAESVWKSSSHTFGGENRKNTLCRLFQKIFHYQYLFKP